MSCPTLSTARWRMVGFGMPMQARWLAAVLVLLATHGGGSSSAIDATTQGPRSAATPSTRRREAAARCTLPDAPANATGFTYPYNECAALKHWCAGSPDYTARVRTTCPQTCAVPAEQCSLAAADAVALAQLRLLAPRCFAGAPADLCTVHPATGEAGWSGNIQSAESEAAERAYLPWDTQMVEQANIVVDLEQWRRTPNGLHVKCELVDVGGGRSKILNAAERKRRRVQDEPFSRRRAQAGASAAAPSMKLRVTYLRLAGCGLQKVPQSMGALEALTVLNLDRNALTELPNWLGKLKRLSKLSLRFNELTGLPLSLGDLEQLDTLLLAHNNLKSVLLPLHSEFGPQPQVFLPRSFASLMDLDLSSNSLDELPTHFASLPLRSLDVHDNNLLALPHWFSNLTSLEALDVSKNQLRALPSLLGRLPELQTMAASHNLLTEAPFWLGQMARLRSLLLNNNRISSFAPNTNRSAVWESAAGASSRVTRLRQLDLSHNRLKRLAAEATIAGEKTRLSGFLRNSFALDYLDVSHNSLTTQGLPTDLGKMTKLVELDLSSNSLSFLPEYLALSSLRVLNVGKNPLLPVTATNDTCRQKRIDPNCKDLFYASVCDPTRNLLFSCKDKRYGKNCCGTLLKHCCHFPDGPAQSFLWDHQNIVKLRNLVAVSLKNTGLTEFPAWLTKIKTLEFVDVSNNHFTSLPTSVPSQLTKLTALNLDGNRLASVPSSLSLLANLNNLGLSNNRITSLPASLVRLRNLLRLSLSNNILASLPPWLGKFKKLKVLAVGGRKPRGWGPNLKQKQTPLQQQRPSRLQAKCTSGSCLPSSIGQLRNLRELQIVGMNLGALPKWVCGLTNLTALDVQANGLRELPSCLHQLTQLETLQVSRNGLFEVPAWIGKLQMMRYLDLSFNNIGELPVALTFMHSLQSLKAEGNRIEWMPQWLGSLGQLEVLHLHANSMKMHPCAHWDDPDGAQACIHYCPMSYSGTFPRLKRLRLSDNLMDSIPICLGNFTSLTELDLSNNVFKNSIVCDLCGASFPPFLHNLFRLEILRLRKAKLFYLPTFWGLSYLRLRELVVSDNRIKSLPANFEPRVNIRRVEVSRVQGGLTSTDRTLKVYTGLHHLVHLDLSANSFSSVPDWVGQMSELRYTSFASNLLQSVPSYLMHLNMKNQVLEALDLRRNPMTHVNRTRLAFGLLSLPPSIQRLSFTMDRTGVDMAKTVVMPSVLRCWDTCEFTLTTKDKLGLDLVYGGLDLTFFVGSQRKQKLNKKHPALRMTDHYNGQYSGQIPANLLPANVKLNTAGCQSPANDAAAYMKCWPDYDQFQITILLDGEPVMFGNDIGDDGGRSDEGGLIGGAFVASRNLLKQEGRSTPFVNPIPVWFTTDGGQRLYNSKNWRRQPAASCAGKNICTQHDPLSVLVGDSCFCQKPYARLQRDLLDPEYGKCGFCDPGQWPKPNAAFPNVPSSLSARCTSCTFGKISPTGRKCSLCPAGTFPDTVISTCKACPTGRYSSLVQTSRLVKAGLAVGLDAGTASTRLCAQAKAGYQPVDGSGTPVVSAAVSAARCANGTWSSAGALCKRCPAGKQPKADGALCEACPAGKVASGVDDPLAILNVFLPADQRLAAGMCVSCANLFGRYTGNVKQVPNKDQSACVECLPGHIISKEKSGLPQCLQCPARTEPDRYRTSCICAAGTYNATTTAVVCFAGSYDALAESAAVKRSHESLKTSSAATQCRSCLNLPCVRCDFTVGFPTALSGWAPANKATLFNKPTPFSLAPGHKQQLNIIRLFHCPYGDTCEVGEDQRQVRCSNTSSGPLCAVCRDMRYRYMGSQDCRECEDTASSYHEVHVTIGFCCIWVMCWLVQTYGTPTLRLSEAYVSSATCHIKITLSFFQVVSLLQSTLDIPIDTMLPRTYSLLNAANPFMLNYSHMISRLCLELDFYTVVTFKVAVIPAGACLVVLLRFGVWRTILAETKESTEEKKMARAAATSTAYSQLLFVAFLLYPFVTHTLFSIFACRELGEGMSYLDTDYRISCVSEQYKSFRGMAAFSLVAVALGVPLLLVALIQIRWQLMPDGAFLETQFLTTDIEAGGLDKAMTKVNYDRVMETPFRYLIKDYKEQFFKWEVMDWVHKMYMVGFLLVANRGSEFQVFLGVISCLVWFTANVWNQPFRQPHHNMMKVGYLGAELIILIVCLILRVRKNTHVEGATWKPITHDPDKQYLLSPHEGRFWTLNMPARHSPITDRMDSIMEFVVLMLLFGGLPAATLSELMFIVATGIKRLSSNGSEIEAPLGGGYGDGDIGQGDRSPVSLERGQEMQRVNSSKLGLSLGRLSDAQRAGSACSLSDTGAQYDASDDDNSSLGEGSGMVASAPIARVDRSKRMLSRGASSSSLGQVSDDGSVDSGISQISMASSLLETHEAGRPYTLESKLAGETRGDQATEKKKGHRAGRPQAGGGSTGGTQGSPCAEAGPSDHTEKKEKEKKKAARIGSEVATSDQWAGAKREPSPERVRGGMGGSVGCSDLPPHLARSPRTGSLGDRESGRFGSLGDS